MSGQNYSLLSIPSTHDHFQSAFMQGYGGHHHQTYDHDRYPSSSSSSQYYSSGEPYLPERRISDPYFRSSHISRHTNGLPANGPNYNTSSFDYSHASMSMLRKESAAAEHGSSIRNLVDFDPRPPHAGWTPKEEIDDDAQSRELLGGNGAVSRTPPGAELGLHGAPISPRSDSLSPGLTVPSLHGASNNGANSPGDPNSTNSKTYSFVSLPGNAVRKRPRRRYDEIERLYACSWPDCNKAYGTLNHLNAHVSMQRHGAKRSPAEFKELRKQWRQQKKQDTTVRPTVPGHTNVSPSLSSDLEVSLRHRRATEPNLSIRSSLDLHSGQGHSHISGHYNNLNHRLSLGDLRYPPHEDDHGLGTSPTSTSSEGLPSSYWQDPPLGSHYTFPPAHSNHAQQSPPLAPLTPPGGHQAPISRLGPGSTLLQPLSAGTLAALEAGLNANRGMGHRGEGSA